MKLTKKSIKKNPKLNVRLLRRVKRHILAEPKRLLMSVVYTTKEREGGSAVFIGDTGPQRFPPCGTAACIAGWTLILSKAPLNSGSIGMTGAAGLLGLSANGHYGAEAGRLFHTCHWPEKFAVEFYKAKQPAARARVAAERIEHFIKTGE